MSDLQIEVTEILQYSRRAYEDRVAQEAIAERERQEANAKRVGQEHATIREWLTSWMPAPLVQFVELHDSIYDDAAHYGYESGTQGVWVQVDIPRAVPVGFRLYRQGDELGFGRWPYDRYNENRFVLPTMVRVECDEDGDPFVKYDWPNSPQYFDFDVALGHAIYLYEEWWPIVSEKLDRAYEAQVAARKPVETKQLDAQERIALSLERLASAIDLHVFGL